MRDHTPRALRAARRLRREMTLPEVLLWRILRQQPEGVKFRRQHPLGGYVVDFYCDAAKLAVEVDGLAHSLGDRPQRDEARDHAIRALGCRIIHIAAGDVLADHAAVAAGMIAMARWRAPPPSALRAATSPGGGGFLSAEGI